MIPNALQIWLKLTETYLNDAFPIAIFNEKIILNSSTALRLCPSIAFGLTVRLKKKYNWAPKILHAMWIVLTVYGYLKSTFANAALFNMVTAESKESV